MTVRPLVTIILFLLVLTGSSSSTAAQDPVSVAGLTPDSARVLYDRAKLMLDQAEREHGGWIQTENGPMHYVEWQNPGGIPFLWAHGTTRSCFGLFPFVPE